MRMRPGILRALGKQPPSKNTPLTPWAEKILLWELAVSGRLHYPGRGVPLWEGISQPLPPAWSGVFCVEKGEVVGLLLIFLWKRDIIQFNKHSFYVYSLLDSVSGYGDTSRLHKSPQMSYSSASMPLSGPLSHWLWAWPHDLLWSIANVMQAETWKTLAHWGLSTLETLPLSHVRKPRPDCCMIRHLWLEVLLPHLTACQLPEAETSSWPAVNWRGSTKHGRRPAKKGPAQMPTHRIMSETAGCGF